MKKILSKISLGTLWLFVWLSFELKTVTIRAKDKIFSSIITIGSG